MHHSVKRILVVILGIATLSGSALAQSTEEIGQQNISPSYRRHDLLLDFTYKTPFAAELKAAYNLNLFPWLGLEFGIGAGLQQFNLGSFKMAEMPSNDHAGGLLLGIQIKFRPLELGREKDQSIQAHSLFCALGVDYYPILPKKGDLPSADRWYHAGTVALKVGYEYRGASGFLWSVSGGVGSLYSFDMSQKNLDSAVPVIITLDLGIGWSLPI